MLLYLVFLCIIAALVQEYTLRHALDKVTYDTFPSKTSVDPDVVFEVVTRIGNPKRLPVSYLKFQESLPLELVPEGDVKLRRGGCLADIAPTMLPYIGLPVPAEMTGKSLIEG